MDKMLKQVQKMQSDMATAQEEVAQLTAKGSAGDGAVVVEINGVNELLSIKIDPEVVDPEDVDILEDLVLVAVNTAIKEMSRISEERMSKVTGGLGGMMGGMPGMPF
jgi:nucleoid-associated protein EbfC